MDVSAPVGPGVIVVAEQSVGELLASCGAAWNVQEPQPSVAAMWEGLSSGRLDQRSRVLVFSDSLTAGTSTDETELTQTARAIVAMAHAGAHVFVAVWRQDGESRLIPLIEEAARGQQVDPASFTYHALPVERGGRAVLDTMRGVLATEVAFPDEYGPIADVPLLRAVGGLLPVAAPTDLPILDQPDEPPPIVLPAEPPPLALVEEPPPLALVEEEPLDQPDEPPPLALVVEEEHLARADDEQLDEPVPTYEVLVPVAPTDDSNEYPPNASLELLERLKPQGQVTITVTSSKGGSGKSTTAILLAGSIARATSNSERPLSVCLVDLDTRDGQVASLIGKFMPTALNIRVQPVWDEEHIRRYLVRADDLGIDTLLAPIRPRTAEAVGPDFYRTIVRSLQRLYDVVILDTGVQYFDPLVAEVALREADEILFVTTLAATSVQGMARALREITTPTDQDGHGVDPAKIGIVINQSVDNIGMERNQVVQASLGLPIVGDIPMATMEVLTATNVNSMDVLLDDAVLGPAFNQLAQACVPGRDLGPWVASGSSVDAEPPASGPTDDAADDDASEGERQRRFFRR